MCYQKFSSKRFVFNFFLKIVEDLADYIALGVTGEIEKRQWSGY
jgi:hypothetical protein